MSAAGARPADNVAWEEVERAQGLIERCMQQYMTQTEIVTAIQQQANIDPGFTCRVWQQLEEQNPEHFFAYNVRLRLRDQIVAFNYLVEQQATLVQHVGGPAEVPSAGTAAGTAESAPAPASAAAEPNSLSPVAAAAATAPAEAGSEELELDVNSFFVPTPTPKGDVSRFFTT